jgi:predicted AlkP superfamily pyrophosphatase or phosphodiesterase
MRKLVATAFIVTMLLSAYAAAHDTSDATSETIHTADVRGAASPLPNDGTAATSGPIVVLITIDGFPARALQDPRLPMPTLRMLEANGAHADAMQPINPTVTWPNHTTLITGVNASEHHVMANGLITAPSDGSAIEVKPWVPKGELVHARTLYDALAEKGMSTGQVDWVAIYGANHVRWQFAERPDVDSPIARDLVTQGLVTQNDIATFGTNDSPAWRDEVWTDAAIDILTRHTPNLLLFHLLQTDTLQHAYGALSPAAYAAFADADASIARLIDAARAAGLLDRITFIIASDHGFASYTHTIRPNVALVQQGLLRLQGGRYQGKVWFLPEGGEASLFIRDNAMRATLMPKLKAYFERVPGIAAVYTNEESQQFGIPSLKATDQAPDLYLVAKPGYAFIDGTDAPMVRDIAPARGAHGYLNSNPDMEALFIASGAHIRRGVDLGAITNLRVAPTIAKILGVSLPEAKQAPLTEALK